MPAEPSGSYRLVFSHNGSEVAFFRNYLDVRPHTRRLEQ
jgi:hypothetical protein